MEFPTIESTATSLSTGSSTTSHTVDMPSGVTAGDLLVIIFRTADSSVDHSLPSGWGLVDTRDSSGRTTIASRIADGTEGSSITITSSAGRRSASHVYRISGARDVASLFTGSASVNPPSLSPHWGAEDTLWIASASTNRTDNNFTAAPTNYSSLLQNETSGNTNAAFNTHLRLASAIRTNAAASENPGAFSTSGTMANQHAVTLAIRSLSDYESDNPNTFSADFESSSSQYVSIADASQSGLDLTGDFTLQAWVNIESLPGLYFFLSKWDFGNDNQSFYWRHQDVGGEKRIYAGISQNGSDVADQGYWVMPLNTAQWYHLALVCDISEPSASKFTLYVNGISLGNATMTISSNASSIYNGTAPFAIGCQFNSGSPLSFYDGLINNVSIYNDARTAQEIKDNMFLVPTPGVDNCVDAWTFNNTYESVSGNNDLTPSGSPTFSTDVPFPEYTEVKPVALGSTTLAEDDNLQGYWTLDNVLTDGSSNGYTLTNNNSATFTDGKFNNAVNLVRSSSQYLSITDASAPNLEIAGSQTWGFWANVRSLHASSGSRVMQKAKLSRANYRFEISAGIQSDQFWQIVVGNGTSNAAVESFVGSIVIGEWCFVVGVLDTATNTLSLYVNGILVGTNTQTGHGDSDADFKIGASQFGAGDTIHSTQFFDGLIDDVYIFNRALTPTEVFELYTGLNMYIPETGALVFGEQNPTDGEIPVSWQTFDDGAGSVPTIIGDQNWGKMELDISEQGRSRVYRLPTSSFRSVTLTKNKYGTGQGVATLQYRVSNTPFYQNDADPSWTDYTGPFNETFQYIQIREVK